MWGKKERHCSPEEEEYGDTWDHVAIDPTSKLVVSLEVGERTQEQTMTLVKDAQSRLAPDCLPAIFTDAYEAYPQAILETFGNRYPVPRQGATGRRPKPKLRCPQGLVYAQVKKHYNGGRVEWVETRPSFGKGKLLTILEKLGWTKVNTSAVERYNGTSRQRDRRKARKTLAFSRESRYHRWMSWLSTTMYNFCHSHRSLKQERGSEVQHRSPAMAAGLTDHIWSVRKRMLCPVLGRG
jgi:IS1 family transposase